MAAREDEQRDAGDQEDDSEKEPTSTATATACCRRRLERPEVQGVAIEVVLDRRKAREGVI